MRNPLPGTERRLRPAMSTARQTVLEILRAALLLALFALNFVLVAPLAVSHANGDQVAVQSIFSICGDDSSPGDDRHAPCHACRLGQAADLPSPPASLEACVFPASPVHYAVEAVDHAEALRVTRYQSRAPPAFA